MPRPPHPRAAERPSRGFGRREQVQGTPCDLCHTAHAARHAILAPSRSRAAGPGWITMADDPYARIAELEAEVAALREREATTAERAVRAETALAEALEQQT